MITKITNALFICDSILEDKSLYIEHGKIKAITDKPLSFDEEIHAGGLYVSPGFIDIHTHGAGGFGFEDGEEEDILKAAQVHAKFGTTTIFPTAATSSFEDLLLFVKNVKKAIEKNKNGKPYIAGSHLEGPYFSLEMRGAQNPAYLKSPSPDEYKAFLRESGGTLKRVSFAPELDGSEALCDFLKENSIVAAFGHTDAVYSELLPAIERGCTLATHLYSGMNTVVRRNCYRHLGAVETAFLRDDVTVEIIADGCHLPPELLKLIYKIKGPDRICLITDSMRGASFSEGNSILGPKNDGVACVIKDGVAFLPDFSSFAGSVATSDRLVRVMHLDAQIPLTDCIKMMCRTPARVMGLSSKGSISEGFDADLVFFDENINIKKVIIGGKTLE